MFLEDKLTINQPHTLLETQKNNSLLDFLWQTHSAEFRVSTEVKKGFLSHHDNNPILSMAYVYKQMLPSHTYMRFDLGTSTAQLPDMCDHTRSWSQMPTLIKVACQSISFFFVAEVFVLSGVSDMYMYMHSGGTFSRCEQLANRCALLPAPTPSLCTNMAVVVRHIVCVYSIYNRMSSHGAHALKWRCFCSINNSLTHIARSNPRQPYL